VHGELPADLRQVVNFVQALLADVERLDKMSPVEHLYWARTLPVCSDPEAPEHLRLALARILQLSPVELQESREAAKRHWSERKRVLDPEWEQLYGKLPQHVQSVLGPKKNLLLLAELLAAAHSPDHKLLEHLLQGFPLIGQLYRSGTLPSIPYAQATETAQSLWEQRGGRNSQVLHRVRRSWHLDTGVKEEFLKKVYQEVSAGHASWVDVKEAATESVLTPRFVVDEGLRRKRSGKVEKKIRLIDDFLASMVNAAASPGERVQHDHLDVLVALARQIGHGRLRFRKCDFVNAFKTLPVRSEDLFLAVAVMLGENNAVWALQLLSCPFGAVGSVHAWHRFGAAVQLILANVFAVAYPRYVDDMFSVDACEDGSVPAETAALADWVIQDLLGWELDPDKGEVDAEEFRALGVDVTVHEQTDHIQFTIGDDRSSKWRAEIEHILWSERLSPSQASKLAGKLSWGATAVFGRGARVFLAPLFHHAARSTSAISGRLKRSLRWWLRYLESVPIRLISLKAIERRKLLIYTDATGAGVMAWVAEYGTRKQFSNVAVPPALRRWVCHRQNQIATWELVAAVCGLWVFLTGPGQVQDGTEIHLFVDNNVALGTLLRGSSRQRDWNELVADIWFQTAARGLVLMCWRVPSKQNLADAPTRPELRHEELKQLRAAGFRQTAWRWPQSCPWTR